MKGRGFHDVQGVWWPDSETWLAYVHKRGRELYETNVARLREEDRRRAESRERREAERANYYSDDREVPI